MSRTILLSTLKQGLQRIREKGGADPDTLYDLENGYVGLDGAVEQRPGTALAYTLPAGTLGMCAHDGDLVVFSTSPKATPAGVRCEVITHPFFPSQGLTYIWFAAPFLGFPYVVAEFENGDVYHYWLQAANEWEASTAYREGQIIVPSTPNGLGYKAHRVLPDYPKWVTGMEVNVGDRIEPTSANGYYYEATATSEADGVGTPGGSPNPDGGTTDPPPGDGGDGGDGIPGGGTVWVEEGSPPDGYEGETYNLAAEGVGDFKWLGTTTPAITIGGFTANVGAASGTSSGSGDLGLRIRGIPLTAHTAAADATFTSNLGALLTHAGRITDSITYAAKPTYSMPNWMHTTGSDLGLVDTTPPWTTARVGTGGYLESRAEFTTGKVRAEYTFTGATTFGTNAPRIGFTVGAPAEPDNIDTATGAYEFGIPADGTYAVEVDATVNPATVTVYDAAGVSLDTGVLDRPTGSVFRFRWSCQEADVEVKSNYGNEAWVGTPSVGFAGLPNMQTIVPVQWDGLSNETYQLSSNGSYGPVDDCSGILTAGGVGLLLGSFGQSSGDHHVEFHDATRTDKQRVGLCQAGQAGQLGTTGTSIGYRNSNTSDRHHRLYWTWGGGGTAELPAGFGTGEAGLTYGRPTDVAFRYNATAAEIEVWIAERDQYNNRKAMTLWTTVTGVPAGEFFPALYADFQGNGSISYTTTAATGADDWTRVIA